MNSHEGRHENARLAYEEALSIHAGLDDRDGLPRHEAALRAEMGEEAFERARRDGRALAWEDAMALVGA